MKKLIISLAMLVCGISPSAYATLFLRGADSLGNRLIYDDDLGITWYDYTRTADTWQSQVNWAADLEVDINGNHYTDWRLPVAIPLNGISFNYDTSNGWWYTGPSDYGWNKVVSEMAHLYYTELGNLGYFDEFGDFRPSCGLDNIGLFQNLHAYHYWTGTESTRDVHSAWDYDLFDCGAQLEYKKSNDFYAVAVRNGDVQATQVPEPGVWVLLGAGLTGLAAMRRRAG